MIYSVFKLFTGLAVADRTARNPKVTPVMHNAIRPAIINIHHLMDILYAKLLSHELIIYQAKGNAIRAAMPTKIK